MGDKIKVLEKLRDTVVTRPPKSREHQIGREVFVGMIDKELDKLKK
jgi:hypothetical protein